MADVKGANYTKMLAANPSDRLYAAVWDGRVRCQIDSYEADALAAGSTIKVGRIPKGAILLPQSLIEFDDLGTGASLDIGDGTDADRWADGIDVSTAAGNAHFGALTDISDDTTHKDVVITVVGAAITGTILTSIFYAFP